MKFLQASIFLLLFISCTNNGSENNASTSENDADAARNFIRAALDGKWDDARRFMLQDSVNVQLLDGAETMYQMFDREKKRSYRESTIRFYETRQINDSTTIIHYSNTYRNEKDSLKALRVNGQWLIDLKYSLLPTSSVHDQ